MFDNIGKKIKKLAEILCYIGIAISIIIGLVVMFISGSSRSTAPFFVGLLIMIIGSLFSWIGSFFTFGFGELIDKVTEIERNTRVDLHESKKDMNLKKENPEIKTTNQRAIKSANTKSTVAQFLDYGKVDYEKMGKDQSSANNKWFCTECARENDNSVKTCKCGHQREDNV